MLSKLRKAYHTNPILFIHIAAFVIGIIFGVASEVFLIVTGIDSIPTQITDANMVLYTASIAFWLANASKKQSYKHRNDESRITYIALIIYSRVVLVAAIGWVLSFVITLSASLI